MLGQFDPQFTEYMNQVMVLSPAGIPDGKSMDVTDRRYFLGLLSRPALFLMIEPGDRVLVLEVLGRFGPLSEISKRCGAEVITLMPNGAPYLNRIRLPTP